MDFYCILCKDRYLDVKNAKDIALPDQENSPGDISIGDAILATYPTRDIDDEGRDVQVDKKYEAWALSPPQSKFM